MLYIFLKLFYISMKYKITYPSTTSIQKVYKIHFIKYIFTLMFFHIE